MPAAQSRVDDHLIPGFPTFNPFPDRIDDSRSIRPEYVRLIRKDHAPADAAHHMNLMTGRVVGETDFGKAGPRPEAAESDPLEGIERPDRLVRTPKAGGSPK